MQPSSSQSTPILVATPHTWGELVCAIIERTSVPCLLVQSHASALYIATQTSLRGIVLDGDWALANEHENLAGIFEVVQQKIPTVTLIRSVRTLFQVVYHPPYHQFCTFPFDVEELEVRMVRSGMLASG